MSRIEEFGKPNNERFSLTGWAGAPSVCGLLFIGGVPLPF
jgi:hypothetical protein